jgi:hypothetical protein
VGGARPWLRRGARRPDRGQRAADLPEACTPPGCGLCSAGSHGGSYRTNPARHFQTPVIRNVFRWPGDRTLVSLPPSVSETFSRDGSETGQVERCQRPGDQRLRQFGRIGALRVGGVAELAYSYGSPVEHPVKKPRIFRHSWPRHTPRRASSPLRALCCKPLGALGSRSLSIAACGATDKFFRQPIGE